MRTRRFVLAALLTLGVAGPAAPAALQIAPGDTALLFGGSDAEGGIGDWYLSNGVVEAIIDDVGVASDLVGVVPAGSEPPLQSSIGFSGGTLIDVGRVGENDDQLSQLLTIGGLSFENFARYASVSAPASDRVRASGGIVFDPLSTLPTPCLTVVTEYVAAASDPFLTVISTATNNCAVNIPQFGGFLDVVPWTVRGIIPFSGGGLPPLGGLGFHHPELDVDNPLTAIEAPTYLGAPGTVEPADGVMDPASGTASGEVSYGLVGVDTALDLDGGGPVPPVVTPVNGLFGVSSTLATALGPIPLPGSLAPGATLTYRRRLYVGARNDVASVSNGILTELAARIPFSTGTISGDVDAADGAAVKASILVTRLGRCLLAPAVSCKAEIDCGVNGACVDPVITPGQLPGAAMSQVRTDASGAFAGVVLPQGDYELIVSAPERDDVIVRPVVVGGGNTTVAIPPLAARGTVAFEVRERTRGVPLVPAKLTFKGVAPTPDPRLHRDLAATVGGIDVLSETFGGTQAGPSGHAAGQGNVVYTATGAGSIELRPGTYDVYVSRGLEYSVALRRVTVAAGGTSPVRVLLKRVIRTRNAVSADFHVHSARSFDASAPLRDRTAAFAAEGVEVMVSTEHDKHVDYGPVIASLGLAARLRAIAGNEVTGTVPNPPSFPSSFGHINAWPVAVAADASRDGAIQDELVAPNWVFKRLRDAGAEVIQYNHPRAGAIGGQTIGIFNNIGCNRCTNDVDTTCAMASDCPPGGECTCVGYQPDRPITMPPNDILVDDGVLGPGSAPNPASLTNLDFDVIEVHNGAKAADVPAYRQVRRDWLSLLNQAIFKPATGVSDSHRVTVEHAGWARSFVFGAGNDPAALDVGAFNAQVKAGNMVATSGPWIEVSARTNGGQAGLGGITRTTDGRVRLRIVVRSAAWIPVEEVRVIANGFQVAAFDASTRPTVRPVPANFEKTGSTSRFRATLRRTVIGDTYFVVEAGAKLPADPNTLPVPPAVMHTIVPDVIPLAITNPVFVDADGNGVFDPPGLPVMTAAATPAPADRWWARLGARLASLLAPEVVAEEAPGEMTGVTQAEKAEAARKGEYFPLYDFAIPPEAVEAVRRAEEAAERARTTDDEP